MKLCRKIKALGLFFVAGALSATLSALPAQAQSVRDILYASDGPLAKGLSYCYQSLANQSNMDQLAADFGFQTPLGDFGTVRVGDEPRERRRSWRLNYTGSTAGLATIPDDDALSLTVRMDEINCEVVILGVPLAEEDNVVPVTLQVLAQFDDTLTLGPYDDFRRILVSGVGPAWHGGLYFNSEVFNGGINFGPRISPYAGALWKVELTRTDILNEKFGN